MKNRKISPPQCDLSQLRTPLQPGEQIVFEFFNKYLSVEWEIYIQPHLNGMRPDFVLLNPKIGIAVFEVKDWNLSAMQYWIEESKGENDKPYLMANDGKTTFSLKGKDPVTRIRYYKEMIEELFCPRMQTTAAKALITAGIIFTKSNTDDVEKLLKPLLDANGMRKDNTIKYYPVGGYDALLQSKLEVVFPEASRRYSGEMKPAYADDLRGWLEEPSIAHEQRIPLSQLVDSRQKELILNPPLSGFRRIRGPAGSGKSLVLAGRAGQLVAEGKDILIVAYNITLLHYLQDLAVRWSDKSRKARKMATWLNFHFWCRQVFFEAGKIDDYRDLWLRHHQHVTKVGDETVEHRLDVLLSEIIPSSVGHILNSDNKVSIHKYDAILVDEGQDFRPEWWNFLRQVLKTGGEMMLVADATQDLYGTAKRWTDESMKGLDTGFRGPWSTLDISYRLPIDFLPYVRKYADQYLPLELKNLPIPKPNPQRHFVEFYCNMRWVQIVKSDPVKTCANEIVHILKRHQSDKLSVADVIFISQRISEGEQIINLLKTKYKYYFAHTFSKDPAERQRLKHAFFLGDARMKATTIHSFKGYEARAMVIFVDENPVQPTEELLYVGLTRLRDDESGAYITVVCGHPKFASYGKTWPEYEEL